MSPWQPSSLWLMDKGWCLLQEETQLKLITAAKQEESGKQGQDFPLDFYGVFQPECAGMSLEGLLLHRGALRWLTPSSPCCPERAEAL